MNSPTQPNADLCSLRLLTVHDLALILCRSAATILSDLTRAPERVPPRCLLPGHNRNLWRPEDVQAWKAKYVESPTVTAAESKPNPAPKKKPGRPPKAIALARQRGSMGVGHG